LSFAGGRKAYLPKAKEGVRLSVMNLWVVPICFYLSRLLQLHFRERKPCFKGLALSISPPHVLIKTFMILFILGLLY
jgi:hypothetical protein